ncbi:similar to Saccharomyces cerevisiae YKL179C COY1 Golgi membrane protein with similarity to mammalian CASP [Maudiozyma saulgeensis]|uniref:Protein CASP n=1 Tax=Maudiozyma saulgeensis TaxID=1789683 RepID=A0A1X7R6U8_9SACH|nr:similar to Saccharomyces cerevisiae YKL179C COY1 Golgi membrane protein with similarity to mammalian CASP [Kazachstania saulgeensis]
MDTSVYSHALDVWSKADLTNLQKELDTNVIEVKDKENESLESRKVLATETKHFKKLEENEKLTNINKIIKKYQQEVDSLTKRSKFAEQIVFEIYSKLSEAPDPKPLLQSSLDKLSKVDDSKILGEKVAELEDKLAKHADYESIKSRLLDLEQNSAVTLSKRLASKEQELNSSWKEKERNWQERETDLNKQVESLQNTNKALESKVSKQVDLDNNDEANVDASGEKKTVSITEYNFIAEELESIQSRAFQLEKRNETLSGELAKATSDNEKASELQNKERKINQLESENALLSASVEKNHNSHERSIKDLTEQISNAKVELDTYKSENDVIRLKLNNYSDYNKIKEELTSLKKIEFGIDEEDNDKENSDSNKNNDGGLQNTLITTNKKLQSNLAELRTKNIAHETETKKLKKQIGEMNGKLDNLQKLNAKLEADLEKIDDIDNKFNDTTSMISGVTRQITNRVGHGASLSPTSSIIGIPEEEELQTGGGNSQILPIVTKQRDRFRARNTDLEKQVRQIMIEKAKLKTEKAKLQDDNSKLYEKVRYLSSYDGSSRHGSVVDPDLENIDREAQYSNNYEASLHPLANFKRDELEYYKKNKLSVLEKLFISFANLILQNKTTRMAFFFYCIGLHSLIFIMCMYVANISGYMTPEVAIVKTSSSSAST